MRNNLLSQVSTSSNVAIYTIPHWTAGPTSYNDMARETSYNNSNFVNENNISGAKNDERIIAMWLSGRPSTTIRSYACDIATLRRFLENKELRNVTAGDILDFAEYLAQSALSSASRHRTLAAVKSIMAYAHKLGYLKFNPSIILKLPKLQGKRAARILGRDAVNAILAAAPEGRNRLIIQTLYYCGLREAELTGLVTSDLRQTGDRWTLTILGKGDKTRTIRVATEFGIELAKHAAGLEAAAPMFRSRSNKKISTSDIYRIVRRAGEAAGYNISPHWLRHAFASHALQAGAPLHLVSRDLGHADISTTGIYLHALPDDGAGLYLDH